MAAQAPQLYKLLSNSAEALQLDRPPQLFLQHSQQAALHFLQIPVTSRLPGLASSSPRQRRGKAAAASVQQQHGVDAESAAAGQQAAVVVTSRMVELLQPAELQAMFVGALSTALVPGLLDSYTHTLHAASQRTLLSTGLASDWQPCGIVFVLLPANALCAFSSMKCTGVCLHASVLCSNLQDAASRAYCGTYKSGMVN